MTRFPELPGNPQSKHVQSNTRIGSTVPNFSAARQDTLPSAPATRSTRKAFLRSIMRQLETDPNALVHAAIAAIGAREAMSSFGQTVDQNLLYGNVKAEPVNEFRRVVVVPPSPDAEQLASALEFAKANASPGDDLAVTIAAPFLAGDNYANFVMVSGVGEALSLTIPANSAVVVDELGITSFDEIAEYEVVFGLGHNNSPPSATSQQNNTSAQLLPFQRGFPYGSVDVGGRGPAQLHGRSRLAPQRGPQNTQTRLVLVCQHTKSTTAIYKPTFHYFEIALRGWKLTFGPDLLPQNSGVGGEDEEV